jgi:uncharacterized membrane protein YkvA (DUF1232 family)
LLRFDDWAASLERMDIVKIDAEGAEPDVLRGMSSSLQRLRPRLLAVEVYAPYLAAAGVTEAEIVDFLADHGYVRERTIGNNVVFRLRGTETAPAQPEGRVLPGALRAALYPAAALVALAAWFAKAMVLPDYNPIWQSSGIASDVSMFVLPGCALLAAMAAVAVFAFGRKDHSRALAGLVPDCVTLAGRLLADRRVPRRRKLLLLVLIAYLAMPIDPIPDFIPIAGQLDDLLVFALVFQQFLRAGGEPLVRQHWPGPSSSLRLVLRLSGA